MDFFIALLIAVICISSIYTLIFIGLRFLLIKKTFDFQARGEKDLKNIILASWKVKETEYNNELLNDHEKEEEYEDSEEKEDIDPESLLKGPSVTAKIHRRKRHTDEYHRDHAGKAGYNPGFVSDRT